MGESRKTSELVRRGKPVNLQKENQWTGSNSVQLEQWQLSLQPSGSCWIQWSVYIPLQLSCSTILPAVDHILYMVIHWEIFDINVSFQPSHNNKEDVEWQGKQLFWMFTPVVECWQAIANQWQLQQHALTEYCHPGFPPVFDIDDLWMPLLKGLIVRHRPTWSARGHVCVCLSADLWFGQPACLPESCQQKSLVGLRTQSSMGHYMKAMTCLFLQMRCQSSFEQLHYLLGALASQGLTSWKKPSDKLTDAQKHEFIQFTCCSGWFKHSVNSLLLEHKMQQLNATNIMWECSHTPDVLVLLIFSLVWNLSLRQNAGSD